MKKSIFCYRRQFSQSMRGSKFSLIVNTWDVVSPGAVFHLREVLPGRPGVSNDFMLLTGRRLPVKCEHSRYLGLRLGVRRFACNFRALDFQPGDRNYQVVACDTISPADSRYLPEVVASGILLPALLSFGRLTMQSESSIPLVVGSTMKFNFTDLLVPSSTSTESFTAGKILRANFLGMTTSVLVNNENILRYSFRVS